MSSTHTALLCLGGVEEGAEGGDEAGGGAATVGPEGEEEAGGVAWVPGDVVEGGEMLLCRDGDLTAPVRGEGASQCV